MLPHIISPLQCRFWVHQRLSRAVEVGPLYPYNLEALIIRTIVSSLSFATNSGSLLALSTACACVSFGPDPEVPARSAPRLDPRFRLRARWY
jgi:hypothetical protein